MDELRYLRGYGERVLTQVRALIDAGRLGEVLRNRYSAGHQVRDDKALFEYVVAIKDRYMRKSDPLNKVVYDNKLHVVKHALGTHTAVSRAHGGRLKAAREIRIATLFRDAPGEFLEMIAVHELAHLKHRDHDKAFYQLCAHMSADYHQREFDLRLYLTQLKLSQLAPAERGPHAATGDDAAAQAAKGGRP
ncbi:MULTISPECIES: M48 family metallopeptidase [Lysobacter]|uniref:M48 family metallopeptidase n=1 Tax=Lysobacter firmicutimachus TaxID=1792846 RepID=A0ABU8D1N8_9GAMM|nr:M48 family metallopeptidase [Lysobacter antibioticus]